MKKSYLAFLVSFLVLVSIIIWLFNAGFNFIFVEYLQIIVILFLVGFGIYFGIRRLRSELRKEPSEDELSKKLVTKASSIAFFVSIYLWLIMMYISDKKIFESDIVFGIGILGMALVFVISFIILKIVGLKNE